jgi:alpha-tubulin suppressor-like RCC1 family protein
VVSCVLKFALTLSLFLSVGQIFDMACGSFSSLVLSNSGKVFMFGDAKDNSMEQFRTPVHIHNLPKSDPTVAIGMSAHTAVAVSDTGNIYRWTVQSVNVETDEHLEAFHAIKGTPPRRRTQPV